LENEKSLLVDEQDRKIDSESMFLKANSKAYIGNKSSLTKETSDECKIIN
jgi:hypothetical protein